MLRSFFLDDMIRIFTCKYLKSNHFLSQCCIMTIALFLSFIAAQTEDFRAFLDLTKHLFLFFLHDSLFAQVYTMDFSLRLQPMATIPSKNIQTNEIFFSSYFHPSLSGHDVFLCLAGGDVLIGQLLLKWQHD